MDCKTFQTHAGVHSTQKFSSALVDACDGEALHDSLALDGSNSTLDVSIAASVTRSKVDYIDTPILRICITARVTRSKVDYIDTPILTICITASVTRSKVDYIVTPILTINERVVCVSATARSAGSWVLRRARTHADWRQIQFQPVFTLRLLGFYLRQPTKKDLRQRQLLLRPGPVHDRRRALRSEHWQGRGTLVTLDALAQRPRHQGARRL